jgi:hypothetical protein
MTGRAWNTSGDTLRMGAATTLRGLHALLPETLDPSDPRRWSRPPPPGLEPIIPCPDPEDVELESPWRGALLPRVETPLPYLPRRRVMAAEERSLLTRAALVGVVLVTIVVALVALAARFSH